MDCKHEYKVLDKEIEIESISFFDSSNEEELQIKGYVIFYCQKCCEIKKKLIE